MVQGQDENVDRGNGWLWSDVLKGVCLTSGAKLMRTERSVSVPT